MKSQIKKALISEKSYLSATTGKFTFLVDKKADKGSIGDEVEKLFGVNVVSVNSANYEGKIKLTRRNRGKRADFKKVIVTLKPGQKIDLFELEKPEEVDTKKAKKINKAKKSENENKEVKE